MNRKGGLQWLVMGVIVVFLFYLGKTNYHQRNPAEFVLIILGAMAVLIFAFYLLRGNQQS